MAKTQARLKSDAKEIQPGDVLPELIYKVKELVGFDAELDFSWKNDAVTICDMRVPSSLRYRNLYTREEIQNSGGLFPDLSLRVSRFMS